MKKFSKWLISEAISASAVDSVNKIIQSYLAKKIGAKVYKYPGVEEYTNSTGRGYGIRYFYKNKSIRFNWKGANITSFTLDSIDLWDGTTSDPNWHMDFESQASLVKTLPMIVDLIMSPYGQGTFYLIPDSDNIKESTIVEAKNAKEDAFDYVINLMKNGKEISNASMIADYGNSKVYNVFKTFRNNYSSLFKKDGSKYTFIGTSHDIEKIKAEKDSLVKSTGGVKVEVSKGGKNETYAPTEQEAEIESKGIGRIVYEEQLKHLAILMKLVMKGATNALFVAGRGGCLAPQTEINIWQPV